MVLRAISRAEDLVGIARNYADDYATFAGAWIELPRVVIAFTGDIATHVSDAAALFGDRVVIRQVRFSLSDLTAFTTIVEAEQGWLPAVAAKFVAASIDEPQNEVILQYQAPSRDVERLIRAHFGNPPWLGFVWEGVGAWAGPTGDLELTVVNRAELPVSITCLLTTTDPRVGVQPEERDLVDGKCFDKGLAAVKWRAEITYSRKGEELTLVKEFVIPADGTVVLKVVVDGDASLGVED